MTSRQPGASGACWGGWGGPESRGACRPGLNRVNYLAAAAPPQHLSWTRGGRTAAPFFFPGERRPRGWSPLALETDGRKLFENRALKVRRPGFHVYAFERANDLLGTTVSQNRIPSLLCHFTKLCRLNACTVCKLPPTFH